MFQASFIVSQHLLTLAFLVHKLLSLDSAHSCEVIAGACSTDERLKALQVRPPAYLTSAYIVLPCTFGTGSYNSSRPGSHMAQADGAKCASCTTELPIDFGNSSLQQPLHQRHAYAWLEHSQKVPFGQIWLQSVLAVPQRTLINSIAHQHSHLEDHVGLQGGGCTIFDLYRCGGSWPGHFWPALCHQCHIA